MRVTVVGAGPAGLRCAQRLAAGGAAVTLLGAEPALPYDRVALSRLLAGDAELPALISADLGALRAAGIAFRAGARAAGIDRAARRVVTARGEAFDYDHCVLALGAHAVMLPLPGATLPGVLGYRSMADVQAMLRAARGGGPAVVIGGGLLGLEAAAGLARRGMRVTVLHAVGWPMERQLDAAAGALLARHLRAQGIGFVMPAATVAIEGAARVTGVRLGDGRVLPASLVVMAVGIRPETALAAAAGLPVGRGIVADARLRTADPAISAIGECAEVDGRTIGLVAPALEQAETAAAAILGQARAWAPRADATALKISGAAVWSGGEVAPADAEAVTLRDPGADHYRCLWLRDGRLVGAVLYGDAADAGFYLDLIARRVAIGTPRAGLALGPGFARAA